MFFVDILLPITVLALIISFFKDKQKTFKALKIAFKKFKGILPAFITMLILISVVLFLVPEATITHYLGNSNITIGIILALFFGSITMMPGFIAFPLCGLFLKMGISFTVLSAFSTTLMMVGIMTYPVEASYLGHRVTIIRNIISMFIAVAVALAIGLIYGELF